MADEERPLLSEPAPIAPPPMPTLGARGTYEQPGIVDVIVTWF